MVDNAGEIHWNLLRILAIWQSATTNYSMWLPTYIWVGFFQAITLIRNKQKYFHFGTCTQPWSPLLANYPNAFCLWFSKILYVVKGSRRLMQSLHLLGLQVLNRLKVKGIWIIIFTRHHVNLAQSALFSSFGNSLIHPCFQCSCRYFIFLYHVHYTTPATNSISIHSIHQRLWDRLK